MHQSKQQPSLFYQSPGARGLGMLAQNSKCLRWSLLSLRSLSLSKLSEHFWGLEVHEGQSPFAIQKGNLFERWLLKDSCFALREMYEEIGAFDKGALHVIDLEQLFPETTQASLLLRGKKTRELISEQVFAEEIEPCLILKPRLSICFVGKQFWIEPDFLISDSLTGLFRIGEIKSYPDRAGQTEPMKVQAAALQCAIGLLALEQLLEELGKSASLCTLVDLVLKENGWFRPSYRSLDVSEERQAILQFYSSLEKKLKQHQRIFESQSLPSACEVLKIPNFFLSSCRRLCSFATKCRNDLRKSQELMLLGERIEQECPSHQTIGQTIGALKIDELLSHQLSQAFDSSVGLFHQQLLPQGLSYESFARLRAFQTCIVQVKSQVARRYVSSNAYILSFLAMAGEENSIHMIGLGKVGVEPEFYSVLDPRNFDAQEQLFLWLAEKLRLYVDGCLEQNSFPQIWFSSVGASQAFLQIGERMLTLGRDPSIRNCGAFFAYLAKCSLLWGQQTIFSAVEVLKEHFVTGLSPQEEMHLGAFLLWFQKHQSIERLWGELEEVEAIPMGYQTMPLFDQQVLAPLLSKRRSKSKEGAFEQPQLLQEEVHKHLEAVLRPIHQAIENVVNLFLDEAFFEPSDFLKLFVEQERVRFRKSFGKKDRRLTNNHFPSHMSSAESALFIDLQEQTRQVYDARLLCHDRIVRFDCLRSGELLLGEVVACHKKEKAMESRSKGSFVLISQSFWTRIRHGDIVYGLEKEGFSARVIGLKQGLKGGVEIEFALLTGMRKWGLPKRGEWLFLSRRQGSWNQLLQAQKFFSTRLRLRPQTHGARSFEASKKTSGLAFDVLAVLESFK